MQENKSKILFLYPRIYENKFDFNLGSSYIMAYLKKNNINSKVYLEKNLENIEKHIIKILKFNIKIIGITCDDSSYYLCKLIAESIKKKDPTKIIIFGGPTATNSYGRILNDCEAIDICCIGFAEESVYKIIKEMEKTKPNLKNISGVVFKNNQKIIKTKYKFAKKNLDLIPSPYLTKIIPKSIGIITSRGCYFNCIFCNYPALNKKVLYHSINRVIEELKIIKELEKNNKNKNKLIEIYDAAFSTNLKRAKEICKRMIKEKLNLKLWCETRVDLVDNELLNLMKTAGFQQINFGLETANLKTIRFINKINTKQKITNYDEEKKFLENFEKKVNLAKKIGFDLTVSVIMGFPNESYKDMEKTIKFLEKLEIKKYYHNILNIFPKTPLYENFKNKFKNKNLLSFQTPDKYSKKVQKSKKMFALNHWISNDFLILKRIFSGCFIKSELIKKKSAFLYLSINNELNDKNLIWIKKNIAFFGVIIIFIEKKNIKNVRKILNKIKSFNIPINRCFFLINKNKLNEKEKIIKNNMLYQFSIIEKFKNINKFGLNKELKIIQIKNKIFLLNLIKKYIKDKSVINFSSLIKNFCMFLPKKCPATKNLHIIINKDNNLKPCSNFNNIGKIGDDYKQIKKNILNEYENERKKRKCNLCEYKTKCSKCPFPYPFTREEFCYLIKNKFNKHF